MKRHSEIVDMTEGPILPSFLRLSFPLMSSTVLQLLFNSVDMIVVGRYAGDNSLAAVGSNGSIIAVLTNLFLGLSVGASLLAARFFGANDKEGLHHAANTAIVLSIVSGCSLAVIGFVFAPQILIWANSPPGVLPLAALYLRIYFLGMPAAMLYNFGAALLRAIGNTRSPLIYLTFAGILNILLNLLFVIVFDLDVAGVALATVLSQCVSAGLVFRCLLRSSDIFSLNPRKISVNIAALKTILRSGIPACFQGVVISLSNVALQASVNIFGEVVVAGSAAACNIEMFTYSCISAMYQSAMTFTSQNIGAGKVSRVLRVFFTANLCVFTSQLILGCLVLSNRENLLGIYSSSPDVITAGTVRLGITFCFYAISGLMEVTGGCVRGMGYNIMPTAVTFIGICAFRLIWFSTIFQIPEYHIPETVYWSYPNSWVLSLIMHLSCFLFGYHKIRRDSFEHRSWK